MEKLFAAGVVVKVKGGMAWNSVDSPRSQWENLAAWQVAFYRVGSTRTPHPQLLIASGMETQTIIVTVAAVVAALATTGAAVGAWRAASEARRAVEAQLLATFLEEYAEPRMHAALQTLREWADANRNEDQWDIESILRNPAFTQMERANRTVKGYFDRVVRLHRQGYVSKSFVDETAHESGIEILFGIIEPVEKKIGEGYDPATFDALRRYSKK